MNFKKQHPSKVKKNPDDDDYLSSRKTFTDQALVTFIKSKKYKCLNSHLNPKDAYQNANKLCLEEGNSIKLTKRHRRRYSAQECVNNVFINELVELEDKMMEQAKRIMNTVEVKYTRNENQKDREEFEKLRRIDKAKNLIGELSRQSVVQKIMQKTPVRSKNVTSTMQKKDQTFLMSCSDFSFSQTGTAEETRRQQDAKRQKFKEIVKKKKAGEVYACERKKQSWLAFKEVQRMQLKLQKNKVLQVKNAKEKTEEEGRNMGKKKKKKQEEECVLAYKSAGERTKALIDYNRKFKEVTNVFSLNLNK